MLKIAVFVVLCSIPFVNHAQQNNWGKGLSIEISGFQASANRIHGEFDTKARPGFGAALLKRFPVSQKWSIETGIGFTKFNPQFTFYNPSMDPATVNGTENFLLWGLNANLYYLRIPLFVTYNHGLTPKSALNFSAGINTRVLVAHKVTEYGNFRWDGMEDLQNYNPLPIISPQVAIGYSYALKNNSGIHLEAFTGRDMNRFVDNYWNSDLGTGSLSYFGLNLRYTFGRSVRVK
ncbi:hypothetical protein D3C71_52970 [compost metagenome]